MKIALIGTLVYDEIQPLSGPVVQSWGGLAYAFLTLAAIAPELTVLPIVNMGKDLHEQAIRDFSVWPNIDPAGLYPVSAQTNRVTLRYTSEAERVEVQHAMQPHLTFAQAKIALACDLILVNFISGTDMEMAAYHQLCHQAAVPVYTDLHSMVLGRKADGVRFPRPIPNSREWFRHTTFLQMNEAEAALQDRPEQDENLLRAWINDGLRAVLMTCGKNGVRYAHHAADRVEIANEPAYMPEKAVDPTGCGDAFGAAFCYAYLKNGNVPASVRYANRIAGFMAQLSGLNDMALVRAFAMDRLPD